MKNYTTWLIMLINVQLYAQVSCDGFNAATYQHTTTVWDWRVASSANWTAYVKDGANFTTTTLPSPFESAATTQPNVEHFYIAQTTRDYEPTDGWELLYKNFGTALNGTDAVENPGFALYNRFTGIMRIFLFARTMSGELITGAKLRVGFNNAPGKQSNALAYTKSISKASDQMDKNIPPPQSLFPPQSLSGRPLAERGLCGSKHFLSLKP